MRLFQKNYSDISDEDIMRLSAKGDGRAFNEIYERYSSRLLNYFYRMLWKDREKAEDFMQDLFTKIVNRPELYNPERPFKTWVFSVANNMCKNEYKKQEVRKNTSNGLEGHQVVGETGDNVVAGLDKQKFNEVLDNEIQQLDEKHKSTFVMRFKDEMSIKEISQILEISEGTVKSRIFYTLKKLGPKLQMFDPKKSEIAYD